MPSEYSPGLWRVDPAANCDIQTGNGLFEIASTHPSILNGGDSDTGRAKANAKLIASAPALLEALQSLLQTIDAQVRAGIVWDPETVAIARAAIAASGV